MKKIETFHLSKRIKRKYVYEEVNLSLEAGNVYGIVGANGSGKTMLLRTLAGLILPTKGSILIDGKECKEISSMGLNIGLVIENISLYPDMTAMENLRFLAGIRGGLPDNVLWNLLNRIGLGDAKDKKVSKYSLGMRQKLSLAQAFMESPELLLLDEPTNALDEASIPVIRQMIKEQAENGAIVLIASHNKEDIEELCTKVYQMSEGRLTLKEEVKE